MSRTSRLGTSSSLLTNIRLGTNIIVPTVILDTTSLLGTRKSLLANIQFAKLQYEGIDTLVFSQILTNETLHNPIINETLTFTQLTDYNAPYNKTTSQFLTINQLFTLNKTTQQLNNQTLNFNQNTFPNTLEGIDTLVFSQILTNETLHNPIINETLTFTQLTDYNAPYNKTTSQFLTINQLFTLNKTTQQLNNQTLNFNQNTFPNTLRERDITQSLTLSDLTNETVSFLRSIDDTIDFTQLLVHIYQLDYTQAITLTQTLDNIRYINQNVNHELIFNELLSRSGIFNLNIDQLLKFNLVTIKPIPLHNLNIAIPQAQVSVVSKTRCVTVLTIPTRAITLPCPNFNDSHNYQTKVTIKRSMSNVLYSWVKKNQLQKLNYTFSMGREKSLELEAFITQAIDQVITMTNWKGEIWLVNLTNNPISLSPRQLYEPERERVEVTLEFQGIKIAG